MPFRLIICTFIVAVQISLLSGAVYAQTIEADDDAVNLIPAPFSDFFESLRGISQDTYPNAPSLHLDYERFTPKNTFQSFDNWFEGITGLRFSIIFASIGRLFVWLIETVAGIITWAISFVGDIGR
jgi:hypothetical protein